MTTDGDSTVHVRELFKNMSYEEVRDSFPVTKEWLAGKEPLVWFTEGKFIEVAVKGEVEPVKDLCTNENVASFVLPSRRDMYNVLQSSLEGQSQWSDLGSYSRGKILSKISKTLLEKKDLLTEVDALTVGSNLSDVKRDGISTASAYFRYYGINAYAVEWDGDSQTGVVLVSLPAPTPLLALAALVAPALAAGSAVLVNPHQQPLLALVLAEICTKAGLPPGVLNVLPGPLGDGKDLLRDGVAKALVWGGKSICKQTIEQLSTLLIPVLPFYYGKSVAIIFDSCDKETAFDILLKNMSFTNHQLPWSVRTVLVEEAAFAGVAEALKKRLTRARVGSARLRGVDVPLAEAPPDDATLARLDAALKEFRARGVEVFQVGGGSDGLVPASLLIGSDAERNALAKEPDALPLVALVPFRRASDAVAFANKSHFGAAASVWSGCLAQAMYVASALEVGTVWINDHGIIDASVPITSHKHGFGCIGGPQGMQQMAPCPRLADHLPAPPDVRVEDARKAIVKEYGPHYGGAPRSASGIFRFYIKHPSGGYYTFNDCDWNDARKATSAAQGALAGWARGGAATRAVALEALGDALLAAKDSFSEHFCKPAGDSDAADSVSRAAQALFAWSGTAALGGVCDAAGGVVGVGGAQMHRVSRARGVIAIVVDGGAPFEAMVEAVAAAMALGNAVVLIPDVAHTVATVELCALAAAAPAPGGVRVPPGLLSALPTWKGGLFNVMPGERDVQAVWYVGSVEKSWETLQVAASKGMKLLWRFPLSHRPTREDTALQYAATQPKALWLPFHGDGASC